MFNKKILYVVLIILLSLIIKRPGGCVDTVKPNRPVDNPTPVVVVTPELESNFIYDDLEKSQALAKFHKRKVIIVFGAEWCPYCKKIKQDSEY